MVSRCSTMASKHGKRLLAILAHLAQRLMEGGQHFAVDIQLKLFGGCVPDAHGLGVFIAGKPGYFAFGQKALTSKAVHDLNLIGTAGNGA